MNAGSDPNRTMLLSSSTPRVAILALGTFGILMTLLALSYTNSLRSTAHEVFVKHVPEYPKLSKRAKVGKVSVAANKLDIDVIHRALLSHEAHNKIHGYPQFTAPFQAVDELSHMHKKRPSGAWTKPAVLLSVVVEELEKPEDERLQWVYWFDADTVVLNPRTKLEVFLPPKHDKDLDDLHLLISSNWDGINSGVFALRVHPWTVSLLSAILAYPIYEKERVEKDRFRDQSAFHWLLEEDDSPLAGSPTKGKEHWTYVPMRWFNSLPFNNAFDKHDGTWLVGQQMSKDLFDNGTTEVYDDGHGGKIQPWKVMQGDMVVHFAGSSHAGTRDSWMGPWLERAEAVLPQWANDTTQEVLAVETKEFWKKEAKRLRELKKDL